MRHLLVVAAVAVLLPAALARPDAETYSPHDGGYTVKFPGKPQETTRKAKADGREVELRLATYATSRGEVFVTAVSPAPGGIRPENRPDFLDRVVRGVAGGFEGRVTESKDTEFGEGKFPGRSFTVEKGRTFLRGFVVLRDDRVYQVTVTGPKGFVDGKEAKAFLDSFKMAK
jgi:hypothetical protein